MQPWDAPFGCADPLGLLVCAKVESQRVLGDPATRRALLHQKTREINEVPILERPCRLVVRMKRGSIVTYQSLTRRP